MLKKMNITSTLQNERIKCIFIQQICVDLHVPDPILGSGDAAVSKGAKVPGFTELTF